MYRVSGCTGSMSMAHGSPDLSLSPLVPVLASVQVAPQSVDLSTPVPPSPPFVLLPAAAYTVWSMGLTTTAKVSMFAGMLSAAGEMLCQAPGAGKSSHGRTTIPASAPAVPVAPPVLTVPPVAPAASPPPTLPPAPPAPALPELPQPATAANRPAQKNISTRECRLRMGVLSTNWP